MNITAELICHPDTPCPAVQMLQTGLEWLSGGDLHAHYQLTADLNQILIPAAKAHGMADGLWEHTCFEAFIAVEGDENYREFNFSPSGQWAAYAFSNYRVRSHWHAISAPSIRFNQTGTHIQLDAEIAAADLPLNFRKKPFQIGLTAVIETVDGNRSYWALHHPASHPDFHHRDGFLQSFTEHRL